MNWEAIGALGEVLGALAVFATLIYLALQVKHSRRLLEENQRISLSQAYQARANMRMDTFKFGMEPHGGELLSKYMTEKPEDRMAIHDELTPGEKFQIRCFYGMNLQAMDNTLYQAQLGLIDQSQMQKVGETIRLMYPVWMHAGATIPEQIGVWYRENVIASGDVKGV